MYLLGHVFVGLSIGALKIECSSAEVLLVDLHSEPLSLLYEARMSTK